MSVLCRIGGGGGEKKRSERPTATAAPLFFFFLFSGPEAGRLCARLPRGLLLRGSGNLLLVKGAAECVLARCSHAVLDGSATPLLRHPAPPPLTAAPLSAESRRQLLASVDDMASRALRVLALAVRVAPLPKEVAGYAGGAASAPAPLPRQLAAADGLRAARVGPRAARAGGAAGPPTPRGPRRRAGLQDRRRARDRHHGGQQADGGGDLRPDRRLRRRRGPRRAGRAGRRGPPAPAPARRLDHGQRVRRPEPRGARQAPLLDAARPLRLPGGAEPEAGRRQSAPEPWARSPR